MELNQDTRRKLIQLSQRPIKKGEVFLLARLLADKIPVIENGQTPTSILGHTLKYRHQVDTVVYGLNDYVHISTDTAKQIYAISDALWSWRYAIATGTAPMLFSGDTDTVIDDVSGLLTYVNMSDICAVADIAQDANYIHSLLRDVVNSFWG